jgi:hypothetical protein
MALFDGLQAEILTKVLRNHMKKNGITLICVTDNGEKLEFKQFSTDQVILEKSKLQDYLRLKAQGEQENEH